LVVLIPGKIEGGGMTKQSLSKNKLLKLKEWLTVPEAARYLCTIFEEEVRESDLLRMALDGHLKLSVYFVNNAEVRCGKVVPYEDAEWEESTLINFVMADKPLPDNVKGNPQKTREYINQLQPTTVMKSLNLMENVILDQMIR
jgi:hypothetical protein